MSLEKCSIKIIQKHRFTKLKVSLGFTCVGNLTCASFLYPGGLFKTLPLMGFLNRYSLAEHTNMHDIK